MKSFKEFVIEGANLAQHENALVLKIPPNVKSHIKKEADGDEDALLDYGIELFEGWFDSLCKKYKEFDTGEISIYFDDSAWQVELEFDSKDPGAEKIKSDFVKFCAKVKS